MPRMSPGLRKHRRTLTVICLAWTLALALLLLTEQHYANAEQHARDWLSTNPAARRATPNPQIVFLGIDDASRDLDTLFADEIEKSRALRMIVMHMPVNDEDLFAGCGFVHGVAYA